jgi:UDP-N-acetylglucosamine transferase subunit ALG13
MIFVITGTEAFPFDRMIQKIDSMKKDRTITDDVFIQLGSCGYIPTECKWEKWLPFTAMRNKITEADLVIAHAGAGTTLLCLEMEKTPLIVTRRKVYGEHLDDHQVPFARRMDVNGYAVAAYDVDELPACLEKIRAFKIGPKRDGVNRAALVSYLNGWLGA